jgi:hypothetical protein
MKCKYCKKEFDKGITKNFCSARCLNPSIWWYIYTKFKLVGLIGITLCLIYLGLNIVKNPSFSKIFLEVWIFSICLLILGFMMWSYNPFKEIPNSFKYTFKKTKEITRKFTVFMLFIVISNLISAVLFSEIKYKGWFIFLIILSGFLIFFTNEWFDKYISSLFKSFKF